MPRAAFTRASFPALPPLRLTDSFPFVRPVFSRAPPPPPPAPIASPLIFFTRIRKNFDASEPIRGIERRRKRNGRPCRIREPRYRDLPSIYLRKNRRVINFKYRTFKRTLAVPPPGEEKKRLITPTRVILSAKFTGGPPPTRLWPVCLKEGRKTFRWIIFSGEC